MIESVSSNINPFSVNFISTETLSEFSTSYFRVELRQGIYGGNRWCWVRVTVRQGSNMEPGSTASVWTPKRSAYGANHLSGGGNWSPGSVYCTDAISLGPTGRVGVTYSGGEPGNVQKKSITVY